MGSIDYIISLTQWFTTFFSERAKTQLLLMYEENIKLFYSLGFRNMVLVLFQVDCFSFGMFMYELITLHQPFEGQECVKDHILDGGRPSVTKRVSYVYSCGCNVEVIVSFNNCQAYLLIIKLSSRGSKLMPSYIT